jgi:predicted CXXCH cytochrome family protein
MRKEGGAMKRLLLLGVGSALTFTMGGGVVTAQADNGPHISSIQAIGTTNSTVSGDKCAGCHRIHTAQSSDGKLLKTNTEAGLCFSCHGTAASGASTNVVDGVGYENPTTGVQSRDRSVSSASGVVAGALRGGGFSYALIGSSIAKRDIVSSSYHPEGTAGNQTIPALVPGNQAPAATTSTHTVGQTGTAWGNGALNSGAGSQVALECGSCHDPHGNGNYRILRAMPNGGVAQPARTVIKDNTATTTVDETLLSATAGIVIPDATSKVYTTTDYWQTGSPTVPRIINGTTVSSTVTPDGFIANVSDWCTTCHTRDRGDNAKTPQTVGGVTAPVDSIFTYRHTTSKIDVVGTRNCITCHVAHGTNALATGTESSQVLQPDGQAAPTGDSRLLRVDNRGICLMCHNV